MVFEVIGECQRAARASDPLWGPAEPVSPSVTQGRSFSMWRPPSSCRGTASQPSLWSAVRLPTSEPCGAQNLAGRWLTCTVPNPMLGPLFCLCRASGTRTIYVGPVSAPGHGLWQGATRRTVHLCTHTPVCVPSLGQKGDSCLICDTAGLRGPPGPQGPPGEIGKSLDVTGTSLTWLPWAGAFTMKRVLCHERPHFRHSNQSLIVRILGQTSGVFENSPR